MAMIADPQTWPKWQPEIRATKGPERLGPGAEVDGVARMLGFDVEGKSRITEIDAAVLEEDVVVGVRMRVRYEVKPQGNGTIVARTVSSRLMGGVLGRGLSFLLRRRLIAMQKRVLANLADQTAES